MMTSEMSKDAFQRRVNAVRQRIQRAAERSDRDPRSITLIGVSKTVDRSAIDVAYAAGLRVFGENRVQDASQKLTPRLPADAKVHLIGQLQSNKAKAAVHLFDVIESVDRPSLVSALAAATSDRPHPVPILLQVNVAREPQKAGCTSEDTATLIESLLSAPGLELRGLMTIAPLVADAEIVRPVFAALRALRGNLRERYPELDLSILSMGMSNDFEVAVEEGATHVRVGRALFQG